MAAKKTPQVIKQVQLSSLEGRFDAAQTSDYNRNHWLDADGMSPDAAYSPAVRKTLRERARLEFENNCLVRGVVTVYVNDIIGTGPRLQIYKTPKRERIVNEWNRWVKKTNLVEKLHTLITSRIVDGEGLGILAVNPSIKGPIQLDVQLFETDRLTDPNPYKDYKTDPSTLMSDGITFDNYGNPVRYSILKAHPGDLMRGTMEALSVPTPYVLHTFRQIRAEQHRGVSELAPALSRCADLRRYTSAVLGAAETAANFVSVIKSDNIPENEAANLEPMDRVLLEPRLTTVLPAGWDLSQLRAEQPTTTYGDFKREVFSEICRCLNIPYVIGAADASKSNFSSARLDGRSYLKALDVEHMRLENVIDKIFNMFLMELSKVQGFTNIDMTKLDYEWLWEYPVEVDPREAGATETKLNSNQITLADVYASQGYDWEKKLETIYQIKEREAELEAQLEARRKKLGLVTKQDNVPAGTKDNEKDKAEDDSDLSPDDESDDN